MSWNSFRTLADVLDMMRLLQYLLLVCFIEYVAASVSLILMRNPAAISVIWYANVCSGVFIASTEKRYWPTLIGAALLTNILADYPFSQYLHTSLLFLPGNGIEILLTALATKYCIDHDSDLFENPSRFIKWFSIISILPPLIGGLVGATLLYLKGLGPLHQLYFTWWQSSLVGTTTLLPIALLFLKQGLHTSVKNLCGPRCLLTTAINIAVTYIAFAHMPYPYAYLSACLVVTALLVPISELSVSILICGIITPQLISITPFNLDISQAKTPSILVFLPLYLTVLTPLTVACLLRNRAEITKKLQVLSSNLNDLYNKTPAAMYTLNDTGHIVSVSDQWLTKMGYNREQVIGRLATDFMSQQSAPFVNNTWFDRFRKTGECRDVSVQMRTQHGQQLHTNVSAVWHQNGSETLAMAVVTDVSEEKRLNDALQQEKELLEVTFRSIRDGVIVTDNQHRIKFANPSAQGILQLPAHEIINHPFQDIFQFYDENDNTPLDCPVRRCLQQENLSLWPEVVKMNTPQGSMYLRNAIAPISNNIANTMGAVLTFQDITDVRSASQRMNYLAEHDSLTGLANRRRFIQQLDHTCQQAQQCELTQTNNQHAVFFLDLDNFKALNDNLGHTAGDELLKLVATELKETLHNDDTICRFGGDEFIALAKHIEDAEHALVIASRMAQRINGLNNQINNKTAVTTSVGIALYPDNGNDAEQLINRADMAMYQAKSQGKNQVCFFQDNMERDTLLQNDILNALAEHLKQRAMLLHYQPIIDTQTGRVCGAEALCRWPDSGRMISPDEFIPLAEKKGLIYELTLQVLSQAISQLVQWQEILPSSFTLSINISSLVLLKPSFVADVLHLLWNAPIEPSQLIFELTESVLIHNADEASKILERIHSLGISIAIDDFGTGYSSLRYLKELPIDVLKIDRSLVADAHQEQTTPFLELIMGLVKKLDLIAVAEGVEYAEQWQYLKSVECQRLQGFLVSQALPAAEFSRTFLNGDQIITIPKVEAPLNE